MKTQLSRTDHRLVAQRIIVRGVLDLQSPTCLGSGEADSPTDMPLLIDSMSKCALLTGTSIAGALRNYLLQKERGYESQEQRHTRAAKLFGDLSLYDNEKSLSESRRQNLQDQSNQSPLIVNDSISDSVPNIEIRDSVKIDGVKGIAVNQAKFDFELLSVDTKFPLYFELIIEDGVDERQLKETLAIALQGLQNGEISLGMKKRRGFGRCKVTEWQVWDFDLTDPDQCREWLEFDHWTPGFLETAHHQGSNIADLLGVSPDPSEDRRKRLTLEATFSLEGSLLIRSGQANIGKAPDVVHLKSKRDGNDVPVISGTSLAGVLRHRAERIIKTLQDTSSGEEPELVKALFGDVHEKTKTAGEEPELVKALFGDVHEKTKTAQASRLIVHEAEIKKVHDMVQNRIAIDRFTGGAYHGALFDEQPVWGGDKTELTINLEIRDPSQAEIGLLLLLLKDLWTGDLPVGGESSIGRGRLKGKCATIIHYEPGDPKTWTIKQGEDSLEIDNSQELEIFVQELVKFTSGEGTAS